MGDDNMLCVKNIDIQGKRNRYEIKKLIKKDNNIIKYKKNINMDLPFENQLYTIRDIYNNFDNIYFNTGNNEKYIRELNKKINGYKIQDIKKKIYYKEYFISLMQIIKKLIDVDMECNYCKCKIFIIYNIVRELKQWSLDRIDNNKGHTADNTIISCLECNLQRRNKPKHIFEFTKSLIIHKNELL